METPPVGHGSSKFKLLLTIATFVALGVLVYATRDEIVDVIKNLGEINALALLLIIPLKLVNFDSYARLYRSLFGIMGEKVSYWPMYKLNLEFNFINYILPSAGVSGISYFALRARSFGISATKGTLAQIAKFQLLFVSFQPLLIVGLIFLAARNHVNNLVLVTATSLITMLIIGTLIGFYIIESRRRINSFLTVITRVINRLVKIFSRRPEAISVQRAQAAFGELHDNYQLFKRNWRALKGPFYYTMMANLTEIAALYVVYIAFGEFVNIGAVILAYAVANFAGLISVLPAGIGIYEALMAGVLVATGIPASLSIPVTIMFRVIMMFLQIPPGYVLYHKAVKRGLRSRA